MTAKNKYLDLVYQLQIYLMQEYLPHSWLEVSRESYLHYRNYAAETNYRVKKSEERIPAQGQRPAVRSEQSGTSSQEKLKKSQELIENQKVATPQVPLSIPPPNIEKNEQIAKSSSLEKPAAIEKHDFNDIRKTMSEHFPAQMILPKPPDDTMAKILQNAWKAPPRHLSFLANLSNALQIIYGVKAEVIGKSLVWGSGKEQKVQLNDDLESYLLTPQLKVDLWKMISQKFLNL